jgi:LPXTG-site transpeptidase (sortase) family protein
MPNQDGFDANPVGEACTPVKNRLAATVLITVGVLMVLTASAGFLYVRSRAAVQATHPDPHLDAATGATARPLPPPSELATNLAQISSYAANRQTENRPAQPRVGVWVEIPALKISLPVREGDGGDRLPQWVALHYPGTAAPGAQGNSYVYAHGLWGMFGGLLYARPGDEVDLHDYSTGSVRVLHVSRVVGKVAWNDKSWIHASASRPTLTLQTCVDDNVHGRRFIVQAT